MNSFDYLEKYNEISYRIGIIPNKPISFDEDMGRKLQNNRFQAYNIRLSLLAKSKKTMIIFLDLFAEKAEPVQMFL